MRSDQPLPLNKRIGFNFTLHVKHIGNVAGVVGRVWITLPRNWRSSLRAAETHCPADPPGKQGEGRSDCSPAPGAAQRRCWRSNRDRAGGAAGVRSPPPGSTVDCRFGDPCLAHDHGTPPNVPLAGTPVRLRKALAGHSVCGPHLCAFQGRLVSLWVTGTCFGCLARLAADAFPQAGQLGSQGCALPKLLFVLSTQDPDLLLLRQEQRSDAG